MPLDQGHDFIIVSDLHMSTGYDPRIGTFRPEEDFRHDSAFARFLDNLCDRATNEHRRWRLLILGDLFDFARVDLQSPRPPGRDSTSEEIILAKLNLIAEGHTEIFEALGRFVAAGFLLDLVPGNHDIELMHMSAQECFKELVAKRSGQPEVKARITFYPWIYYVPGVLYAEHGNQYHDINWWPTPLRPYLPHNPDEIELPLAHQFEGYLFNLIEAVDPSAENVRQPLRHVRRAFQAHPVAILTTWRQHMHFARTILSYLVSLAGPDLRRRRAAYHEEMVRPYAAQLGLSFETVVAIDDVAAAAAELIKGRILRKLFFGPALRALPRLGALTAMYAALRKVPVGLSSFTMFATGILGLVRREGRQVQSAMRSSTYLRDVPLKIHRVLQAANESVPYYVFGHTHSAEQFPIANGAAHYLNPGTWTQLVAIPTAAHKYFTFVQITRDRETGAPIGRLLMWDDAAGRPEPLA